MEPVGSSLNTWIQFEHDMRPLSVRTPWFGAFWDTNRIRVTSQCSKHHVTGCMVKALLACVYHPNGRIERQWATEWHREVHSKNYHITFQKPDPPSPEFTQRCIQMQNDLARVSPNQAWCIIYNDVNDNTGYSVLFNYGNVQECILIPFISLTVKYTNKVTASVDMILLGNDDMDKMTAELDQALETWAAIPLMHALEEANN